MTNPDRARLLALADEIECTDGLIKMSRVEGNVQLGIEKTAQIITALRAVTAQCDTEPDAWQCRNIGKDGKPWSTWYPATNKPTSENMAWDGVYSYEYRPLYAAPARCGAPNDGLRQALRDLIGAAQEMPRATPGPGGASTLHDYKISAADVWALDRKIKEASAALATPPALPAGEEVRRALEPFATFGLDESAQNIRDGLMRDRICDWFGSSDFDTARTVFRALSPSLNGGGIASYMMRSHYEAAAKLVSGDGRAFIVKGSRQRFDNYNEALEHAGSLIGLPPSSNGKSATEKYDEK